MTNDAITGFILGVLSTLLSTLDAKLNLANFDSTVLWKVDFSRAKLRKTRLLNARIEDCVWTDAKIDETTEIDVALRQVIVAQTSDAK